MKLSANGRRGNKLRAAYVESMGHHVHMLPCGSFGTVLTLFKLAKARGFDGAKTTFWQRLQLAGGKKTLAELSLPRKAAHASTKKRTQSDEIAEAIAALDARKAAIGVRK